MNAKAAGARAAMAGESPDPSPQERAESRDRAGQGRPATRSGRDGTSRPARSEGAGDALEWTERLDPTSAIDQVGLEATIGLGPPAREARLDARLRAGTDPEAAGHTAAAETAGAHAEAHERDAAYGWSTPDPADTDEREDLDGQDHARGDEHLAAGERATAAEERGAASAAATRAEVTFTPGDTPSDGNRARVSRVPGTARPVCTRQDPERSRGR